MICCASDMSHVKPGGVATAAGPVVRTAAASGVASTGPPTILGVDEDVIEGMRRDFGFARATMPPGHYRGVAEETATVDFSGWLVFCREDVPAEWAYAFAKACDETKEQVETYPEVRRSLRTPVDSGYLFTETVVPLHDGAAAYARERGYLS